MAKKAAKSAKKNKGVKRAASVRTNATSKKRPVGRRPKSVRAPKKASTSRSKRGASKRALTPSRKRSASKKAPATPRKRSVPKKAAVRAKPAVSKSKPPAPKKAAFRTTALSPKPLRRRDGAGHIEPKYAAELLAQSGAHDDDGSAFLPRLRSSDDLAEELGEEFVQSATSGEAGGEDALNQVVPEESGGPFVTSSAGTEFADGTDESNPRGAKREPFPTT